MNNKTLLINKTVNIGDTEIYFSVSPTLGKDNTEINAFVIFPTGGRINHTERFIRSKDKKKILKVFEEKEPIYVEQILKAKKDYDNRRT